MFKAFDHCKLRYHSELGPYSQLQVDLDPFRAIGNVVEWGEMFQAMDARPNARVWDLLEEFTEGIMLRLRFANGYSEEQISQICPGDVGIFDLKNGGAFRRFCNVLDDSARTNFRKVSMELLDSGSSGGHSWYGGQLGTFKSLDVMPSGSLRCVLYSC